ncbi:hypothetical protein HYC85_023918 [Camellia sinensis]|uniref:Uncharacterized protein n=1 Tax=Camellia sinensis TaxID=4442 RepID=A0A7J7GFV9_CAMSI|nr:hypothetical protein HYC85_023918 [Camellia sinensis]
MVLTNSSFSTLAKPLSPLPKPLPPSLSLSPNFNKTFDLNSPITTLPKPNPSSIQPHLQFHPHPIQNHFFHRHTRGSGSWTRTKRRRE